MAHSHDGVYRELGHKIDGMQVRAPWNETFAHLLAELYSPEEAELIVKMPYGLASEDAIARVTHHEPQRLHKILEGLATKGLVMDLFVQGKYRYMPSPMVVGIFELVMMRTGDDLPMKDWARIFHEYLHGADTFYAANAADGQQYSIMRTLPHPETVLPSDYTEVLDYDKAEAIIEDANCFAIGYCSCRREKRLATDTRCEVPLETCTSMGIAADYMIRRGLARQATKTEMQENLSRAKDLKLVLTADNVQDRVKFICHCCKDCCNLLLGVTQHGYPGTLTTSRFISQVKDEKCTGCGRCVEPCPVDAIKVVPGENKRSKRGKVIQIDEKLCLGCGVCGLVCALDGIALVPRQERVLTPATTFERVILMCLERGTLQNQLFDNPSSISHKVLRGIVGGFLRLPAVKQKLMSDQMRSRFLASMQSGASKQGQAWALKV